MSAPPSYESVVDAEKKIDPNYTDAIDSLLEKHDMMSASGDVEAQRPRSPTESEIGSGKHAAEYRVPTRTKYLYLGVYFGLNLGLTLFNKAILGKVRALLATFHSVQMSLHLAYCRYEKPKITQADCCPIPANSSPSPGF